MMKRALVLFLSILTLSSFVSHAAAQLTGGGKPGEEPACSNQAHHCCWNELLKITTGDPIDQAVVDQHKGPDDITWWGTNQSENIPVICRAADYWKNGDGAWFKDYFDDQLPGGPAGGFQGSEVLSPLYMPWVTSAVMAVLERSKDEKTGDAVLQAKAERWLRTYWALNSLMARQGPWTKITSTNQEGTFVREIGNTDEFNGLATPVAGARRVSESSDPTTTAQAVVHIGQMLTTLALDHSPRGLFRNDYISDDYFRSLRLAVHLVGGVFNPDETIDFQAVPAPVERFGLTPAERATLKSFVANPGGDPATLNAVLGYIDHGTRCRMTFLRTTQGTTSWFGDGTIEQSRCNANIANWYGVTMTNAGEGEVLTPRFMTHSRRNGTKIEAYRVENPSAARRIDVLGGDTIYRVHWRSSGPSLEVYNPPSAGGVDLRLVATYRTSATGPEQTTESDSDDPAAFGFYYDETLGNFEERPGGPCNLGHDNPSYLEVAFEGDVFDSCTFQSSWDAEIRDCDPSLVSHLIAGNRVIIGTDDSLIDPATCTAFEPAISSVRPGEQHWMRLTIVKDGQSYPRRVRFFQSNPTPAEVQLVASYAPGPGQARVEVRSELANPTPVDFYYDEAAGNFEQRPGTNCNTGQDNQTYFKMKYDGPPIISCSYQASWDPTPTACTAALIGVLEAGTEFIIGTDRYEIDPGTCIAAQPLASHLPFDTVGSMRFDVTTAEGSVVRLVKFIKRP